MNVQLFHPQRDILEAFGLGKLEDAQAASVEQHLSECPACCATLLALQDDTFVELVRGSETPAEVGEAAATRTDAPRFASQAARDRGRETHSPPPELANHPRYRVLELLGRGGMGEVYRAEHRLMNRPVAIKVIHDRLVQDARAVERFRRETQAAARLAHPNIVAAYDAEQAGELHFLAMEYIEGTDLAQYVQQHGPMPAPVACACIRQAAEALQHAHERGMVHRDIKPQNLMLQDLRSADRGTQNDRRLSHSAICDPQSAIVKVLDFGLARFAAEAAEAVESPDQQAGPADARLTSAGAAMGTPDYIAPEQSRCARDADIRSDIYSLGCTLYFLLAGQPPFPHGSAKEKLQAHAHRQPQPLAELRGDLPPGLEDVVRRMMAKAPGDRYQRPADIVVALAPFASLSPAEQAFPYRTSDKERAGREFPSSSAARRRLWPVAFTLIAATLLCFLGVAFYAKLGETTVKFEIDDPTLAVHFAANEITVNNDGRPIRVTPGEQQTFTISHNGLTAQTAAFTLRKGDQEVLRVSVHEGQIAIVPRNRNMPLDAQPRRPTRRLPAEPIAGSRGAPSVTGPASAADAPTLELSETLVEKQAKGNASGISAFAIAADRRTAYVGYTPGVVAVVDVEAKREVASWQTGLMSPTALAVSGNGRFVAVGALAGGGFEIWDAKKGVRRQALPATAAYLRTLALSPDGGLLAFGAMHRMTTAGAEQVITHAPAFGVLATFAGSRDAVEGWSVPQPLAGPYYQYDRVDVDAVRFSPSGRLLAAAGDMMNHTPEALATIEDFLFVWDAQATPPHEDAATGRMPRRFERVKTHATAIAFTPDEKLLVTGHAGVNVASCVLRVWDVASGRAVWEMRGHEAPIMSLDVSPDGTLAASVDGRGSLRVWSLGDGREIARLIDAPRREDGVRKRSHVAFLADRRSLMTAGAEGVKIWRLPATSEVESGAGANSVKATAELDELVRLAEERLSRVQTQQQMGVVTRTTVVEAEIELLEAKLRRSLARGEALTPVVLLHQLVTLREESLARVQELLESGVVPKAVLLEAQKELAEARLRRSEQEAKTP